MINGVNILAHLWSPVKQIHYISPSPPSTYASPYNVPCIIFGTICFELHSRSICSTPTFKSTYWWPRIWSYILESKVVLNKQYRLVVSALGMQKVFRPHAFPSDIISDHGPQLISKFWKYFLKYLNVLCKLYSSYHPQSDNQTTKSNIRIFIVSSITNKMIWLTSFIFAKFPYNNLVHSSMNMHFILVGLCLNI